MLSKLYHSSPLRGGELERVFYLNASLRSLISIVGLMRS